MASQPGESTAKPPALRDLAAGRFLIGAAVRPDQLTNIQRITL